MIGFWFVVWAMYSSIFYMFFSWISELKSTYSTLMVVMSMVTLFMAFLFIVYPKRESTAYFFLAAIFVGISEITMITYNESRKCSTTRHSFINNLLYFYICISSLLLFALLSDRSRYERRQRSVELCS